MVDLHVYFRRLRPGALLFGSIDVLSSDFPDRIVLFTVLSLLNSSIHCSSVKLLNVGTLTVVSSQFAVSPEVK